MEETSFQGLGPPPFPRNDALNEQFVELILNIAEPVSLDY